MNAFNSASLRIIGFSSSSISYCINSSNISYSWQENECGYWWHCNLPCCRYTWNFRARQVPQVANTNLSEKYNSYGNTSNVSAVKQNFPESCAKSAVSQDQIQTVEYCDVSSNLCGLFGKFLHIRRVYVRWQPEHHREKLFFQYLCSNLKPGQTRKRFWRLLQKR